MERHNLYTIGLDLGTSAVKGVLVAEDSAVIATESFSTQLVFPQEGWVEFDLETFHHGICRLLRSLSARVPTGGNVEAVSIAAASGNTALLDQNGNPLCNCLSWMDKRASAAIPPALAGIDFTALHDIVGWPYCGSFPLAHLAWLKTNRPEITQRAARIADSTVSTIFRLTGRWVVDPSTATPFYLQRQIDAQWHIPFLDALGIGVDALPSILPTGSIIGTLTDNAATETGLAADTKIALGCFDHPAAAHAMGVREPNECLLSCGTSWVILLPTHDRQKAIDNKLLVDPFLQPHGPWAAMSSFAMIGTKIDECAAFIAGTSTDKAARYAILSDEASLTDPGADGCCADLMADSIETIVGKAGGNRRRMARAVMESGAFLIRRRFDGLAVAGMAQPESAAAAGGPAANRVWMRILSDVLGIPLRVAAAQHAGAVGAARIAAVAVGSAAAELKTATQMTIEPERGSSPRYDRLYRAWREKVAK